MNTTTVLIPFRNKLNIFSCNCRSLSTSSTFFNTTAGKYKATRDRSFPLTQEMSRKPSHIGVSKSWLTWHTQNLEGFRQQQAVALSQDEIIRRFVRSLLYEHIVMDGSEIVIKRRGNVVYVAGFLKFGNNKDKKRIYWLYGFTEELLSHLLKQPVKLEFQFIRDVEELIVKRI